MKIEYILWKLNNQMNDYIEQFEKFLKDHKLDKESSNYTPYMFWATLW